MSEIRAKPRPAVTNAEITMLFIRKRETSLARTRTARLNEASERLRFLLFVII